MPPGARSIREEEIAARFVERRDLGVGEQDRRRARVREIDERTTEREPAPRG